MKYAILEKSYANFDGWTKLTSINKLYGSTGWEKLKNTSEQPRLMIIYNCQ